MKDNTFIIYTLDKVLTYAVLSNWNNLLKDVKEEYIEYLLAKQGIQDLVKDKNMFYNLYTLLKNVDDIETGVLEINQVQMDKVLMSITNNTDLIKSISIKKDNLIK